MAKVVLQNWSSFALKNQNFWLESEHMIKAGNANDANGNKHSPPRRTRQPAAARQWVTLSSLVAIKIYIDSLASNFAARHIQSKR